MLCHLLAVWNWPRLFFFLNSFLRPYPRYMEVPMLGVTSELSCRPEAQPQQHGIQATSAPCVIAHANVEPLTHWGRPRTEATSSWVLVGLVRAEPQWGLKGMVFIYIYIYIYITLSCNKIYTFEVSNDFSKRICHHFIPIDFLFSAVSVHPYWRFPLWSLCLLTVG